MRVIIATPWLWLLRHTLHGSVHAERWGFWGERRLYVCTCRAERLSRELRP